MSKRHKMNPNDIIGKRFRNHAGEWYTPTKIYDKSENLITLENNKTIWYYVKFDNYEQEVIASRPGILDQSVKNPFSPIIYGKGCFGFTKITQPQRTKRYKKIYDTWKDMLKRCYDPKKSMLRYQQYKVQVDKTWHNFATFYEWVNSKYSNYRIGYQLDKDILGDGKLYSMHNCVFVPRYINNQLVTVDKFMKLPQGVKQINNRFITFVGFSKEKTYIGTYKNIYEAFYAYKIVKEEKMKKSFDYALEHNHIPKWLYDKLITRGWTDDRLVEDVITDNDIKHLPPIDEFIKSNFYLEKYYTKLKSETFRGHRNDKFVRNNELNNGVE